MLTTHLEQVYIDQYTDIMRQLEHMGNAIQNAMGSPGIEHPKLMRELAGAAKRGFDDLHERLVYCVMPDLDKLTKAVQPSAAKNCNSCKHMFTEYNVEPCSRGCYGTPTHPNWEAVE